MKNINKLKKEKQRCTFSHYPNKKLVHLCSSQRMFVCLDKCIKKLPYSLLCDNTTQSVEKVFLCYCVYPSKIKCGESSNRVWVQNNSFL